MVLITERKGNVMDAHRDSEPENIFSKSLYGQVINQEIRAKSLQLSSLLATSGNQIKSKPRD